MKYDACFRDGKFIQAKPHGIKWMPGVLADFEIVTTEDLQPEEDDRQVHVGRYVVQASAINRALVTDTEALDLQDVGEAALEKEARRRGLIQEQLEP